MIRFFIAGLLTIALAGCEKDNITNAYINQNPDRLDKVSHEFKEALASSPTGWVMMVKSSLSQDVYTPIVLKFDTLTNKVNVTTVYGVTASTDSFFRIANGTGSPQLIFTTGSIMSSLYRIGIQASDITDHIYNVVSVSPDTLAIRGYRSGRVYTPEGGVIYKMFKRPADWSWADAGIKFDMTSADFRANLDNVTGELKVENLLSSTEKVLAFRLISLPANTNNSLRSYDPFSISRNIGTGGFAPMNYFYIEQYQKTPYLNTTTMVRSAPTQGHNAVSIYPFTSNGTNNANTNANATALKNRLETHYLIFKNQTRTGNNVKMEFEAYDQKGKVALRAFYDNLL